MITKIWLFNYTLLWDEYTTFSLNPFNIYYDRLGFTFLGVLLNILKTLIFSLERHFSAEDGNRTYFLL